MMAQNRTESTWEIINYGKYINEFPPHTTKSIRQNKRINKKICRQKMSIMFNEICINEEMLPKYTHTHIYIYIYNWKKNSTDSHLAIIDLFQLVTPYEKLSSSECHHIIVRKIIKIFFQEIHRRLKN